MTKTCVSTPKAIGRRTVLGGLASLVAGPLILVPGKARAGERLVVANWGGGVAAAKKEALYDPFTKETGIPVVTVQGPEFAKMRAQVQAGDVEWDVVDLLDSWVASGEHFDLYEPIDTSIVPIDRLLPKARRKHEIASYFYAGGICSTTSRVAEDKRPKNWADFWNVKAFPGRRALRNRIGETLEIALMADGVTPAQVYPCDVDRAFKALDRIKPHIAQWVSQTPQTTLLVQAGEVDFSYTYVSRVHEGSKAGMAISFSFENNLIGPNWMAVLKGTRNRSAAMRFMEFTTRPDRQLAFCNITGHAPSARGVKEKMNDDIRSWVPEVENPSNLVLNSDWWAGKEEELSNRFKEWLLT